MYQKAYRMVRLIAVLVVLAATLVTSTGWADVKLPGFFSDHMVLQREIAAPVWGWAEPGEKITVTLAGQTVTATAGKDGQWLVKLPAMKPGGPFELVISGRNRVVINDVLVGDVWVCSGQSNMALVLNGADTGKAAVAAATNASIRLLTIGSAGASAPRSDVPCKWAVCSPATAGGFSAVGYFFGRAIAQVSGIPIGLIHNPWGGTSVEAWTSREGLDSVEELAPLRQDLDRKLAAYNSQLGDSLDALARWLEQAQQAKAQGAKIPLMPELPVHPIGDHGQPTGWSALYNSRVAPLTRFAIKGAIWYQGEANGAEGNMYFHKLRALIGGWRRAWGQGDFPFYLVQLPGYLPDRQSPAGGDGWAGIRAAQGKSLQIPHTGMAVTIDLDEANNLHPVNKEDVGERLALWALRDEYGQQDLVCTGPLYKDMKIEGNKIRLSFDSVGSGLMVGRKQAHRPVPEVKDEQLQRFAIAGQDKKWVWADAVIDGSTVAVSSDKVPAPVAVRYAYSGNPAGCNLYNREGLPAAPFRTDQW